MVFSDFRHDDPFRRYSRSKSEVVENRPKFCMFWPPFFWGSAPRIFGPNLSNPPSFRSCGKVSRRSVEGRRRKAGERNKQKKHHEQNRTGGLTRKSVRRVIPPSGAHNAARLSLQLVAGCEQTNEPTNKQTWRIGIPLLAEVIIIRSLTALSIHNVL